MLIQVGRHSFRSAGRCSAFSIHPPAWLYGLGSVHKRCEGPPKRDLAITIDSNQKGVPPIKFCMIAARSHSTLVGGDRLLKAKESRASSAPPTGLVRLTSSQSRPAITDPG